MTTLLKNHSLGQSRYGNLATALRDRILQGEWVPGEVIPAESALAQSYGVALGTIRQALSLLVQDGVLQRRHGKGTFVTTGVNGASMMRFFRFRGTDDAASMTPNSHILGSRLRSASLQEIQAWAWLRVLKSFKSNVFEAWSLNPVCSKPSFCHCHFLALWPTPTRMHGTTCCTPCTSNGAGL